MQTFKPWFTRSLRSILLMSLFVGALFSAAPARAASGMVYTSVEDMRVGGRSPDGARGFMFITFGTYGTFGTCATNGGRLLLGVNLATEHGKYIADLAKTAMLGRYKVRVAWDDRTQVGMYQCDVVHLTLYLEGLD